MKHIIVKYCYNEDDDEFSCEYAQVSLDARNKRIMIVCTVENKYACIFDVSNGESTGDASHVIKEIVEIPEWCPLENFKFDPEVRNE